MLAARRHAGEAGLHAILGTHLSVLHDLQKVASSGTRKCGMVSLHHFVSLGIPGSKNGGTVPYKAIFCGDIPLHKPYISLTYARYLQFSFLKMAIDCR